MSEPTAETETDTAESIAAAAAILTERVDRLTEKLTLREKYERGARRRNIAIAVLSIIAFGLAISSVVGWVRVSHLVHQNAVNARVQCENANTIRAQSASVWIWLIDTSIKQNPQATPAQVKQLHDLEGYIKGVYSPQDCSDPKRKRPAPTPPALLLPSTTRTPTPHPSSTR